MAAIDELMSGHLAEMTIIHETVDHYGKPYERYEMKLPPPNRETFLVDFFCSAWSTYREPRWYESTKNPVKTENRVISFNMRIWITPKCEFTIPLYVSDRFPFRDTYIWEKISRGLGLPKDVAKSDHYYYESKVDYEFRYNYFKYRGNPGTV